jgi:GST-like protein
MYEAGEFLAVHNYQQVRRWADEVAARPAVIRGRKVNRMRGKPEEQVAERHDAADLD